MQLLPRANRSPLSGISPCLRGAKAETALAVVAGANVILTDPVFQGLVISVMTGEIAYLQIGRKEVPALYFMA